MQYITFRLQTDCNQTFHSPSFSIKYVLYFLYFYAFISLLEENDGVLDASQLFSKLRPKVMVNSTQTPQYGKIHMAGDDGGDFLFVRR